MIQVDRMHGSDNGSGTAQQHDCKLLAVADPPGSSLQGSPQLASSGERPHEKGSKTPVLLPSRETTCKKAGAGDLCIACGRLLARPAQSRLAPTALQI